MKKDELIEKLLKIEGNPEIVIPDGCGDWLDTDTAEMTFCKKLIIY